MTSTKTTETAPRCPKCGDVPPIRKVGGTLGVDRITYQCCGKVYEIEVANLKEDEKLTDQGDAA